eukprot:10774750-Alexandrium_andersonii.AAC.1
MCIRDRCSGTQPDFAGRRCKLRPGCFAHAARLDIGLQARSREGTRRVQARSAAACDSKSRGPHGNGCVFCTDGRTPASGKALGFETWAAVCGHTATPLVVPRIAGHMWGA